MDFTLTNREGFQRMVILLAPAASRLGRRRGRKV
jgi:hypothetical protein